MRIAVIGATGKMGVWFCKEFRNHGYDVIGIGRNTVKLQEIREKLKIRVTSDYRTGLIGVNWILVAVPFDSIFSVVKTIVPLVPKDAVVFDILSVKGDILKPLGNACQEAGIQYASTHPMFGPGAENLAGRTIIITPVPGIETATTKVKLLFEKMGARVIEVDKKLHDQMMALVLNIPHLLNILFGKLIASAGFDLPFIKQFAGTTFTLQEFLALNVNSEDPSIYGPLQFENPEFQPILKKLKDFTTQYLEVVEKKDLSTFSEWMIKNDQFLRADPLYSKAYTLLYRLLDLLH